MSDLPATRRALTSQVARIDRSGRARLEITGPDRAKFLHNLTTNEIKRLPIGRGCETFVTSPQGKALGFGQVLAMEGRLLYRTDPGGLEGVLPHFQKYGVFDDVALEDVTPRTFEIHLAGPSATDLLRDLGAELPEGGDLAHRRTKLADREILIVGESPSGYPGWTLIGVAPDRPEILARLHRAAEIAPDDFEALRIEAGTPVSGLDVKPENLPQEIGRDDRAISFVKGCYLGQETVARLDALGHVNKILKGLRIESGDAVAPGTPLMAEGKPVGTITSAAPLRGTPHTVALAMIRVAHAGAGTTLTLGGDGPPRSAVVADLPMTGAAP